MVGTENNDIFFDNIEDKLENKWQFSKVSCNFNCFLNFFTNAYHE